MKQQLSLVITIGLAGLTLAGCGSTQQQPSFAATVAPQSSKPLVAQTGEAQPAAAPVLAAPAPSAQPTVAPRQETVARLNGQPIPIDRLNKALIEGYGLNMLVILVQLDYTKQVAAKDGIVVTPEDVARERDVSFSTRFPDADKSEYPLLFEQLLKNTHTSRIEWELLFETNTYIRKMIEPMAKAQISDATLELAFRQLYGETVQIRHIEVGNMVKIAEAKRRIAAGEPFEKVAAEMSENAHTAPLGGEMRPFSRASSYEQVFKDAAFALKEGEVSDAVVVGGSYQILKLDRRIPPKGVKFEDVKESIREDLTTRYVQANMEKRREQIREEALRGLAIDNPTLKSQYDSQMQKRDTQITNRNEIRERWELERKRILEAATRPADNRSAPGPILQLPAPTGNPPEASEVARPPATQSGAQ